MRLDMRRVSSLPPLSWCVRVSGSSATLLAGVWVTLGEDWFAEGAWDGSLAFGAPDEATYMAGSAGVVRGDHLVVCAPSHNMEHLYSAKAGSDLIVSNSIVFLFEQAGLEPDPSYSGYLFDLIDANRSGIRSEPSPVHGGISIHSLVNLRIGPDGSIKHVRKRPARSPRYFSELRQLLELTMARVFENAADPLRPQPFSPKVALSGGYDSTAVAAVAASLGCRDAVTLVDPLQPADSGVPIANALGLEVVAYERDHAIPEDVETVAEFMAAPAGVDIPKAAMADQLVGSLLLTGNQGDLVFGKRLGLLPDYGDPNEHSGAGGSMIEFRLRTGMLFFPVPPILAMFPKELAEISNSVEMSPWSVGGGYDRPIARRLAEDAGVPRGSFGVGKAATGHEWMHGRLPDKAAEAFASWMEVHVAPLSAPRASLVKPHWLERLWRYVRRRHLRYFPSWVRGILRPMLLKSWWRRTHRVSGTPFLYTFHWAVGELRVRYRVDRVRVESLDASA